MVTCIGCQEFSFKRAAAEDARRGKGHCSLRAPFIRHAANQERDCDAFQHEQTDIVKGRIQWLKTDEGKMV